MAKGARGGQNKNKSKKSSNGKMPKEYDDLNTSLKGGWSARTQSQTVSKGRDAKIALEAMGDKTSNAHQRAFELSLTANSKNEKNNMRETYSKFNEFRFDGLNHHQESNKYMTMDRVSNDKSKVVVSVTDNMLKGTKYGKALILDKTHVVFLKDWQVEKNNRTGIRNEVILDKKYFNVKQWGQHDSFFDNQKQWYNFDSWVGLANKQKDTKVTWQK